MRSKILKNSLGGLAVILLIMQFIRPERTNLPSDPAASFEAIARPPAEVAASVRRACGDCHSNQTAWPWYSHIAPISWFITEHVNEGRAHLNLSEWNRARSESEEGPPGLDEMCEQVQAGKMPPASYALLHPKSRLTSTETTALCAQSQAER